jgi:hypothetical protein
MVDPLKNTSAQRGLSHRFKPDATNKLRLLGEFYLCDECPDY